MRTNFSRFKTTSFHNTLDCDRASAYTMTELLFYLALTLNLIYSMWYPAYQMLHGSYHIIIFGFAVTLFMADQRIRLRWNRVVAFCVFFCLVIAAILINHSGLGLVILILWPLTIIYLFKNSRLSSCYLKRISVLMLVGWIAALASISVYNNQWSMSLKIGAELQTINPNTIAIIIGFTSLFLALYLENTSKLKCFKIAIYCISLIALWQTKSRTSIVAFIFILLLELFRKKIIKKHPQIGLKIIALIVIGGIVFPCLYTYLFTQEIISYQTVVFGKRVFTGRQYIWWNVWEYLLQNKSAFIWGTGYNTEFYSKGTFNLHNAYIQLFAQYGILVLMIYMWYILRALREMFNVNGHISNVQFKCYQILTFILIVGFAEGVLTYLPNLIFIAMAIGIGIRENRIGG